MRQSRRRFIAGTVAGASVLALGFGAAKLIRPGASIVEGKSRASVVRSDASLPQQAEVVIIGGGIAGVCTAFNLAERGISVAVCDKGVIAGEASGRAAGYIESAFISPAAFEITSRAQSHWLGMDVRVGSETSFQQTGILYMFKDREELQYAANWVDSAKGIFNVDPQIIEPQSVARLIYTPHTGIIGGLYLPSDGILDPRLATSVIAEAARARGATIHQQCAVRGIETSAGRVSAAVTERGVIKTSNVILAGGAWSTLFCRNLGIELPQLQAFASSLSLEPLDAGPAISGLFGPDFWRREADGGYLFSTYDAIAPITTDTFRYGRRFMVALREMGPYIKPTLGSEFWRSLHLPSSWVLDSQSPFEEIRIMAPVARTHMLRERLRILSKTFPAFNDARVREAWGGALTTTPDNLPVLGKVKSIPGFTLGTGIFQGITQGPAIGELLADLVMGEKPRIEYSVFRYERFI